MGILFIAEFYIESQIWGRTTDINRISERIEAIKIEIKEKTMSSIIMVYASTAENEIEIGKFYGKLEDAKLKQSEHSNGKLERRNRRGRGN